MSVHIKRYLKSVKMNSSTSTYVNIDITYNKYVSTRALHTWGEHKQKDHAAQLECVNITVHCHGLCNQCFAVLFQCCNAEDHPFIVYNSTI